VSWLSTFKRFQPGPVPLLGRRIALLVNDWSRPQRGEGPMFDSPVLERMAVAYPGLPVAIYVPVGLLLLWRSAAWLGLAGTALLYLAGLIVWSFTEYWVHRGSFHHEPDTESELAFVYLVHGVHHAYPDDSRRWMIPLTASLPILGVLYLIVHALLGAYGLAFFAGFMHGYLTYDLVHYYVHRGRMPGRIGRYLRKYHMIHHYAQPERHFGVSSPLWDLVFRTR
jgi:sterol desaturase/sphingolipid hydroxylase (fatty acid hydroxylase superfamily)